MGGRNGGSSPPGEAQLRSTFMHCMAELGHMPRNKHFVLISVFRLDYMLSLYQCCHSIRINAGLPTNMGINGVA